MLPETTGHDTTYFSVSIGRAVISVLESNLFKCQAGRDIDKRRLKWMRRYVAV